MRLKCLAVWLCIFAGAAPSAMAQPVAAGWGLPRLMREMAQVRSARGRFTERKTIHLLNAPLLASGTLIYVAPNYLRKTTALPVPEDFTLDHGQATITGGPDQQTHSFSVIGNPQIGGLVEGIRATLAGDLPALNRFYTVRLSGSEDNWRLLLRPRDTMLAHFITWMLIEGSQDRITAIDTASGDGDHAEMGIAEDVSDAP